MSVSIVLMVLWLVIMVICGESWRKENKRLKQRNCSLSNLLNQKLTEAKEIAKKELLESSRKIKEHLKEQLLTNHELTKHLENCKQQLFNPRGIPDVFKVFYDVVAAEQGQSGTSTGLALSYIGKAILFPGKKIYIKDHHGTKQSDKLLVNAVNYKINELGGLKGIKLNRTDNSITFSLDKLKAEA